MTTDPAPTTASAPISTPGMMIAPAPTWQARRKIGAGLRSGVLIRRPPRTTTPGPKKTSSSSTTSLATTQWDWVLARFPNTTPSLTTDP